MSGFHIGARRHFSGIVRDITECKRLQDELQRRLNDLAEADRQKNRVSLHVELNSPLHRAGCKARVLALLAGFDGIVAASQCAA